MEEFFTRKIASEGRKMELTTPAGEKTDHYLLVVGIDSDRFRAASVRAERKMLEISILTDADQKEVEESRVQRELVAELVIGWSFEKEFTQENVLEFLREAPQIADQVDRFAANRRIFFGSKPTS